MKNSKTPLPEREKALDKLLEKTEIKLIEKISRVKSNGKG